MKKPAKKTIKKTAKKKATRKLPRVRAAQHPILVRELTTAMASNSGCHEAYKWLQQEFYGNTDTARDAWVRCRRPGWMVWLVREVAGTFIEDVLIEDANPRDINAESYNDYESESEAMRLRQIVMWPKVEAALRKHHIIKHLHSRRKAA
jgi:hypothetical protein